VSGACSSCALGVNWVQSMSLPSSSSSKVAGEIAKVAGSEVVRLAFSVYSCPRVCMSDVTILHSCLAVSPLDFTCLLRAAGLLDRALLL